MGLKIILAENAQNFVSLTLIHYTTTFAKFTVIEIISSLNEKN